MITKYKRVQNQEEQMKKEFFDDKSQKSGLDAPHRMQSMGYNPNAGGRKQRNFSPNEGSRPISRIFLESVGSIEETPNSPQHRKTETIEETSQSPDDWPHRSSGATNQLDRSLDDANGIFYDPRQNTISQKVKKQH
jgi:hypothetical protein